MLMYVILWHSLLIFKVLEFAYFMAWAFIVAYL